MIKVAIIIGSTRPGRNADAVARWFHTIAAGRTDASFEIVDPIDFGLPLLDEPTPAAMGANYRHSHTQAWSTTIAGYDAYVFITPEYNHSTSAALKNAIDFLFTEWNDKAAGFVSYGLHGGTRAVEHLRLVMGELQVADVRAQVALSLFNDFENGIDPNPGPHQVEAAHTMLDQLVAWATALRTMRRAGRPHLTRTTA